MPTIQAYFVNQQILTESSSEAAQLNQQSSYGSLQKKGHVQLSLCEAYYLLELDKIQVYDGRNKQLTPIDFLNKAKRLDKQFLTKYQVFKDLRHRGYTVKTALKFGADFRVYDRGVKPGQAHARWIVYCSSEHDQYSWKEFAAKNRIANSTKKRLLLGITDDEGDVTYYEIKWVKP